MWLCRCSMICHYSHDDISMWYPRYGAPAHFTLPVSQWLDQHLPGRWIGRGSPVAWPARSPDLTPLDFFHWGCMKENVYKTEIASREEFVSKINTTVMRYASADCVMCSERWDDVMKHVFVREGDILRICSSNLWTWSGQEEMETLNNWLNTNSCLQNLTTKWPWNQVRTDTCYGRVNLEMGTHSEKVY